MSLNTKMHCPRPSKTLNHVLFNKFPSMNTFQNSFPNSEFLREDLSKLRGNSQNPQDKDDSFKSQSDPQSFDEFDDIWNDLDDLPSS